jgi:hypothetical protein
MRPQYDMRSSKKLFTLVFFPTQNIAGDENEKNYFLVCELCFCDIIALRNHFVLAKAIKSSGEYERNKLTLNLINLRRVYLGAMFFPSSSLLSAISLHPG